MSVDAKYKTSATASGGGRDGKTALKDGSLELQLVVPKELGGPGGEAAAVKAVATAAVAVNVPSRHAA